MVMILKVDMGGDVRRFRVELPEGSDVASKWQLILEQVRRSYCLPEDGELSLTYRDDEGEVCPLSQETLPDCLALAEGGLLRLIASATPATQPNADLHPTELLGTIRQLAQRPEKLHEMIDLMSRDPAKLFGIIETFKPIRQVIKASKDKWKRDAKEEAAASAMDHGAGAMSAGPWPYDEWAHEDESWTRMAKRRWMRTLKGKGICKGKGKWKCGTWKHDFPWQHHQGAWKHHNEGACGREAGKCPAGHDLTLQELPHAWCNACGAHMVQEDAVVGCRECDWDLCWNCAERQDSVHVEPKQDAPKRPADVAKETTAADNGTDAAPAGPWHQAAWAPKENPWAHLAKGCGLKMLVLKGKGKGKLGKGQAVGHSCAPLQPSQAGFDSQQQAQGFDLPVMWQAMVAAIQDGANVEPKGDAPEPLVNEEAKVEATEETTAVDKGANATPSGPWQQAEWAPKEDPWPRLAKGWGLKMRALKGKGKGKWGKGQAAWAQTGPDCTSGRPAD